MEENWRLKQENRRDYKLAGNGYILYVRKRRKEEGKNEKDITDIWRVIQNIIEVHK